MQASQGKWVCSCCCYCFFSHLFSGPALPVSGVTASTFFPVWNSPSSRGPLGCACGQISNWANKGSGFSSVNHRMLELVRGQSYLVKLTRQFKWLPRGCTVSSFRAGTLKLLFPLQVRTWFPSTLVVPSSRGAENPGRGRQELLEKKNQQNSDDARSPPQGFWFNCSAVGPNSVLFFKSSPVLMCFIPLLWILAQSQHTLNST